MSNKDANNNEQTSRISGGADSEKLTKDDANLLRSMTKSDPSSKLTVLAEKIESIVDRQRMESTESSGMNNGKKAQESDGDDVKLNEADLALIQTMADVNPNAPLALCNVARRVEECMRKGVKISEEDANFIKAVAERNPNSALAQTGVHERALQSAARNDNNQNK